MDTDKQWVSVDERLPPMETPVLIVLAEKHVRVGELCWEYPTYEESFKPFKYWDDPFNDGQLWEWFDVSYWMPLPHLPQSENKEK